MTFTGQPLPETSISYSLAQIPLNHHLGFAEHLLCAGVTLGTGSATENSSSKALSLKKVHTLDSVHAILQKHTQNPYLLAHK